MQFIKTLKYWRKERRVYSYPVFHIRCYWNVQPKPPTNSISSLCKWKCASCYCQVLSQIDDYGVPAYLSIQSEKPSKGLLYWKRCQAARLRMFQCWRQLKLLKRFENLGCNVWSCEYLIWDGTRPSWSTNTHIQKHMRIWTVLTRYRYCSLLLLSSQFHKMAYGNEEFTLCPFLPALRLNSEPCGDFWLLLFLISPFT